ncbi:hypothetical protein FACS189468_8130 [Spirochaetia bacterium]|nr:hypothetical protein FACS189468_8130 [Spirochaetia bacterium]
MKKKAFLVVLLAVMTVVFYGCLSVKDPLQISSIEDIVATIAANADDLIIVATREDNDCEAIIVHNRTNTDITGVGYVFYSDGRIEHFDYFETKHASKDSMSNWGKNHSLEDRGAIGAVIQVIGAKPYATGKWAKDRDDIAVTILPK